MASNDRKQKLTRFLERRAWNPVLRASPQRYAESDRKRLENLKRKTETQKERYRHYESAARVRKEFQNDLRSQPAKRAGADLRRLHLPALADLAEEFFRLADRMGVGREVPSRRPHRPHPPHPWHKSKPAARKRASQQLKKEAREGNRAAIETLRKAPRKWARDLAKQARPRRSGSKRAQSADRKKRS